MRHARQALPLAAFAVLGARAQEYGAPSSLSTPTLVITNSVGNPSSTVTSYYSTCPPGTASTITLPTQTLCPGPLCGALPTGLAGTQIIAQSGTNDVAGNDNVIVNGNGNSVVDVGSLSWTTVINEYCPICESGYQMKNITVTEQCPCQAAELRTALPGYTTTEIPCTVAGVATTTTVFVSCSTATAAISPSGSGLAVPAPAPATPTAPGAPAASGAAISSGSGSSPAIPAAGSGGSGSTPGSPGSGSGSAPAPPAVPSGAPAGYPASESTPGFAPGPAVAPGGGSRIAGTAAGSNGTYGGGSGSTTPSTSLQPYVPGSPNGASSSRVIGFLFTFVVGACGFITWQL